MTEEAKPPIRIQRKRTKGWKMPPNTVSVTRPGRWGNPFVVGEPGGLDAATAVAEFRDLVGPHPPHVVPLYMTREDIQRDLRAKNLACWCPLLNPDGSPHACHADVLLEIANQ